MLREVGWLSRLTHMSLMDFGQDPYPTIKYHFVFFQGLESSKHFSLAAGSRTPLQL